MPPSTSYSTTPNRGSEAEYEHDSTSSQHKYQTRATADQTLATRRAQGFLEDHDLPMAHTYGRTTTAEACRRMAEKLGVFEEAFKKGGARK